MKQIFGLVSIALLLFSAFPQNAYSQNSFDVYEFPYFETDYIECLGEYVDFDVWITERVHIVETPNGEHIVDNWFIEGEAIGVDTGRVWYTAHTASPGTYNSNDDQFSGGWTLSAMYDPIEGGGPKFRKSAVARLVIDANGNLRVAFDDAYEFRCFGH